jgi:hypothetical protein
MKQPSSEEWHIGWPVIHRRCMLCCESFFDEVVNGLLFKLMCKQILNTLIWIEVIWSIEPTWDLCIVWYFSSFINSNRQRSNETLVCAVIRTSDPLGPCRFPCTLPPLLGLRHALQCYKDFSVVIYCHSLDSNYMVQLWGLSTNIRVRCLSRRFHQKCRDSNRGP